MQKPQILFNKMMPLSFTKDGGLLCYKHGNIVLLRDNKEVWSICFQNSFKEHYFGRISLIARLFRLGIRASIVTGDDVAILSIGNKLQELDLHQRVLSAGYDCGKGIRPLVFSDIKDIKGFANGVYFGGYLGNMSKQSVNIYHRANVDQWEVVYTFPQGVINHVHNIVPDPFRGCLWVFTGDFDEASAIWKVTDNFKKVECFASGNQKYRGCVVNVLPEGLLYATDAPFVDDYIYLMNPETTEVKEIFPIHGSCIYGCKWKDKYVFSSTVEGDGRNTSKLEFLLGRKRGAGIKDEYVHMYMGNLQEGFKEIYKEKKDMMPYYTFQFGVFKFPEGLNNSDTLYFQPVATKKHDMDLMALSL